MPERSSDDETRRREADALELLATGAGTAFSAQTLAERYGVSLRQARRYVAAAALELCGELTPHALDTEAAVSLHRLSLIAGRAMAAGDEPTAIRATKAHTAAVAQMRRAIAAPITRFRLPGRTAAPLPDPPADSLPF